MSAHRFEHSTSLGALRSAAQAIHDELVAAAALLSEGEGEQKRLGDAVRRLENSVLRPLDQALGPKPELPDRPAGEPVTLFEVAKQATKLRTAAGVPPELVEATAALQDLAYGFAVVEGSDSAEKTLAELRRMQADLKPEIAPEPNGPYLVTNAENLRDWLGYQLRALPQMALCRCGASQMKPYCDGSHARIGFTDQKSPDRVPDRRDTYVGQQVTILDNRGTCQHSGYCTDRLASVFHLGKDPFVTPSGGRMDEIIRAVRDCPSGALSYAIDGVEARDEVDYHGTREPKIEVTKDGPYRITGGLPLHDSGGAQVSRNEGASREHYALCRCGQSQNKPFCSGMHWYVDFHDPVADPNRTPTMFEWAGGIAALTRMTRLFYEKYVPQDPLLSPLFANMSPDHPQRVAKWLGEVFGGPTNYSDEFGGYPRMLSQHVGKRLTEEQRSRWVSLLLQSAQDAGLPNDPEFRSAFQSYIEWGSRLAVENSQQDSRPPKHMPMPHWDWNTSAGPPGSRVSAVAPQELQAVEGQVSALAPQQPEAEQEVALPKPDEKVGFDEHIKPLFREGDRKSMQFAFDLWTYDDVKENAQAILEKVRSGSMPCDAAWPKERVDVFERWVSSGMRP